MAECPHCEYNKKRAQIWRDEAYKLSGHPLPERVKEWVGLPTIVILDIYSETLKEHRGGSMPDGQIAFAKAIEQALKERNT